MRMRHGIAIYCLTFENLNGFNIVTYVKTTFKLFNNRATVLVSYYGLNNGLT